MQAPVCPTLVAGIHDICPIAMATCTGLQLLKVVLSRACLFLGMQGGLNGGAARQIGF